MDYNLQNCLLKFKKEHDYKSFEFIMNHFFPDAKKCRECGKHILYSDTQFRGWERKNKIYLFGKSYKTVKAHGETLEVCEKCIKTKFKEYNENKKIFNTLNEMTIFAFNIKNKKPYATGVTKEKLIKKYGDIEGKKRWELYRQKQSITNTFEYKKQKYNWTKKQFDDYNASRAVTLNNLIKRYGDTEGAKKWESYLNIQKETKSLQYMINKFGEEKTKEINKSKAITLTNFQRKYGNEMGLIKFTETINKINSFYSNISQEFFRKIDEYFGKKYKTYFAEKNKEYGVNTYIGYKKLDYFIKELNICIEFNGDVFHANPCFFGDNDKPNPYNINLTSKQIWNNDKIRYEAIKKERNIDTYVVWENDYKNYTIEDILKKINLWNFI